MRAIRARYNPYLQVKHRTEQVNVIIHIQKILTAYSINYDNHFLYILNTLFLISYDNLVIVLKRLVARLSYNFIHCKIINANIFFKNIR